MKHGNHTIIKEIKEEIGENFRTDTFSGKFKNDKKDGYGITVEKDKFYVEEYKDNQIK